MAGLDRKKTGTDQTSWEFYIETNDIWLTQPLKADRPGNLVGPDGKAIAYTFKKNEPIQILSLTLEKIGPNKLAKVSVNGIVGWTLPKNISKPTTIARTRADGGRVQEDQETAVIDAINEAVVANGGEPINIVGINRTTIRGVVAAFKNEGINFYRKENYADMILVLRNGMRYGISMKMDRTPSLFGGGFQPMFDLAPQYLRSVLQNALAQAVNDPGFELGSNKKLKDIFIHITNRDFLRSAWRGTEKMGGPVEYMFVGKRHPKYHYESGVLSFEDASFFSIEQYEFKFPKFYIRIRRRDTTQIFTNELDKEGIPYFFKRPNGKERARIVVEKSPSGRALIVKM